MNRRWPFWTIWAISLLIAGTAYSAPMGSTPLNYRAILTVSIPFAFVWLALLVAFAWRYKKRAAWLLMGAPFALYWPIWLAWNGFSSCYYTRNCA
jgi:hypothetical protein